jgi:membrane-bound lytic murein transglycosylase D
MYPGSKKPQPDDRSRVSPDRQTTSVIPGHSVLVETRKGQESICLRRFSETFMIGRHSSCDLQISDPCVSSKHVEVVFDGKQWWISDLGSTNGTYINDIPVQQVPLCEDVELELGRGGPLVSIAFENPEFNHGEDKQVPCSKKELYTETQIIQHYFDKSSSEKPGEETMMFQRAFQRAHKKKSRKYLVIIVSAVVLLASAGGVIHYQRNKLHTLRRTAEDIFYSMKSLQLQIAQLEDIVMLQADPDQVNTLSAKQQQLSQMEKQYDTFVKELGIYKKAPVEEQIIYKLARFFGECDVNVPKDFVGEVWTYVDKWKTSVRLKRALNRAETKGYVPVIKKALAEHNLPPHFFFLALQESDFNARAVGPKTRYGYAKGIWQFIPMTAQDYGLKIGPLYKEKVYDPYDERFDFEKATRAAARYLKNINNTEAQASGLLVMASYNWGENNVREIIRRMPENPRDRNFWRLLENAKIPRQTYDYVFYIFSAAVICENPRLFGFDFKGPMLAEDFF